MHEVLANSYVTRSRGAPSVHVKRFAIRLITKSPLLMRVLLRPHCYPQSREC